ncbi:MAG: tetratricopeptide repeat protein [Candidatus Omnitrophica bacterium]|nr:tetratricopeptide repeat protein [Candidatus Omnitrophota bacterium]
MTDLGKKHNPNARIINVCVLAGFFIAGLCVYFPSFSIPYFFFDDKAAIIDNPAIRDFSNVSAIFNAFNTRFIAGWTYALNYTFGQLNPFGYYCVNISLHLINTVLAYYFLRMVLASPVNKHYPHDKTTAFLASMVFLLHPVQTDAVNYISQRIVLLTTFFCLGAFICYIKFLVTKGRGVYLLSVVLTIAAMFCKEVAFTLPFMIILIEALFFTTPHNFHLKKVFRIVPFLLCLLIIPYLLSRSHADLVPMSAIASINDTQGVSEVDLLRAGGTTGLSRAEYALTQVHVHGTYLRLLLFPMTQNIWYDYPITQAVDIKTLIGLCIIMLILATAVFAIKKFRLLAFCVLAYFLLLSIESSVIPIAHVIAEYRLYFSTLFFGLFFVLLVEMIFQNRKLFKIIVVSFIIFLAILTLSRNLLRADEILFWKDAALKSPNNAKVQTNLGYAFISKGKYEEAITPFLKAHKLRPDEQTYQNLGTVFIYVGQYDVAEDYLLEALTLAPDNYQFYFSLGLLHFKENDFGGAITNYNKALECSPDNVEIYRELCIVYRQMGDIEAAGGCYERLLELQPDSLIFHKLYMGFLSDQKDTGRLEKYRLKYPEFFKSMVN